jgi:hypothetical protein
MPFDDMYQSVLAPMYAVFGTASVQAQCDLVRCFTTMAREFSHPNVPDFARLFLGKLCQIVLSPPLEGFAAS